MNSSTERLDVVVAAVFCAILVFTISWAFSSRLPVNQQKIKKGNL